jgi:two-component system sensor histidine kinase RpfC
LAPAIDTVQLSYLYSIGDQSFVSAMIDSFFEDVAETNISIERAVRDSDVKLFRFCAHAYKSSANNIGASTLATICAKYERITEGDFAQRKEYYFSEITKELTRVESALRKSQEMPSLGQSLQR